MLHLVAEYGDGSQDVVVLQRMSIGSGEGDTIEISSLMPGFALIVRLADGSFVLKTSDPEHKVIDDESGEETSEIALNEGVAVRLGDCRLRCVPASRVSSPSGDDAFESDWQGSCPFCNGAMVDECVTECSACGRFSQGLQEGRVPLRLGAYQVVAWVGTGGMGVVLQGVSDNHIPVALKLIRSKNPSLSSIRRFEEEIRLTGDIPRHPNVVYQESHGTVGKLRWLAIEWISGQTLAQRLVETIGKMEIIEIRRIMLQLVEGLKHLHSHRVIHRDLKPSNIFVRPDGGVKIGDFGLSMACGTVTRATMTRTGAVIGTERYMSPEQHKGQVVGETSDIYSLGLIWQEMLTDYCTGGFIPIDRKDCPEIWSSLITRMLDTAPDRRPILDEIDAALRDVQQPHSHPQKQPTPRVRFDANVADVSNTKTGSKTEPATASHEEWASKAKRISARGWQRLATAIVRVTEKGRLIKRRRFSLMIQAPIRRIRRINSTETLAIMVAGFFLSPIISTGAKSDSNPYDGFILAFAIALSSMTLWGLRSLLVQKVTWPLITHARLIKVILTIIAGSVWIAYCSRNGLPVFLWFCLFGFWLWKLTWGVVPPLFSKIFNVPHHVGNPNTLDINTPKKAVELRTDKQQDIQKLLLTFGIIGLMIITTLALLRVNDKFTRVNFTSIFGDFEKAYSINTSSAKSEEPKEPDRQEASLQNKDSEELSSLTLDQLQAKAESGDVEAINEVGRRYYDGIDVKQDGGEAAKWFRKTASQGNADGQYGLGLFYATGAGETNSKEAVSWFLKAAEQGHSSAQNFLGVCYLEGKGIPQSDTEAARCFKRSAEQGNSAGQYSYGYCLRYGRGVPKDIAQTYMWWTLSAKSSNKNAAKELGKLLKRDMTAEQLMEGQRLVAKWIANHKTH